MNTPESSPILESEKTIARLSSLAHVLCGWPLILVVVGGAIGGGLGGLAYAINLAIYKSKLPVVAKCLLNPLVGVSAFGGWLAIVALIQTFRQSSS